MKLRERYDEALQGLQVAVLSSSRTGGGPGLGLPQPGVEEGGGEGAGDGGGDDVGGRLRQVAELLAGLHAECEGRLWPQIQQLVDARAAGHSLAGPGPAQQQPQGSAAPGGTSAGAGAEQLQSHEANAGRQRGDQLHHQADQITQALSLLALEVAALAQGAARLQGREDVSPDQELISRLPLPSGWAPSGPGAGAATEAWAGPTDGHHPQQPPRGSGSASRCASSAAPPRWLPGSALLAAAAAGGRPGADDPRERVYLDALHALHEAAGSAGQDVAPLRGAVQAVVALLGGYPRVTARGGIIEFYPLRLRCDWRQPLLRSSLLRLYIYATGLLLQQHERHAVIQDAQADLAARHETLAAAASDLQAKAGTLRDLKASVGAQLAALASYVAHGSDLASTISRLQVSSSGLQRHVGPRKPAGAAAPGLAAPGGSDLTLRPEALKEASNAADAIAAGLDQASRALEALRGLALCVHSADDAAGQAADEGVPARRQEQGVLAWPEAPAQLLHASRAPFVQGVDVSVMIAASDTSPSTRAGTCGATAQQRLHGTAPAPAAAAPCFGFRISLPGARGAAATWRDQQQQQQQRRRSGSLDGSELWADGGHNDGPADGQGPSAVDGLPTAEGAQAATPPASPSGRDVPLQPASLSRYTLDVALRAAYESLAGSGGSGSNLPRGEELVGLSNSMLRRSLMSPSRALRPGGASGGVALSQPAAAAAAAADAADAAGKRPAEDAAGPLPAHYERRPLTARAFVEGVLSDQARRQQLEQTARPRSATMPHGARPLIDQAERALPPEGQGLVLANPSPAPSALDALLQLPVSWAGGGTAAGAPAARPARASARPDQLRRATAAARRSQARSPEPGSRTVLVLAAGVAGCALPLAARSSSPPPQQARSGGGRAASAGRTGLEGQGLPSAVEGDVPRTPPGL